MYDGDTLRLDIDCGFNVWLNNVAFRLAGIDAPELGTPEGRTARDWLRGVLPDGTGVVAITYKDRAEKYGRYLADIYLPDDPVTSINQRLIDGGMAKPYDGGAR